MMDKKVKLKLVFIICSAIFILGCFIFYGCRLIKYYKIEHPEINKKENVLLYDKLLAQTNITGSKNGLIKENENYYFKGKNDNNYLMFSGIMYRVVSIDKDKSIKLVSNDNVTLLNYGSGSLENSNIYAWLTNNYIKTLDTSYLTKTKTCIDNIDDIKKVKCSKYIDGMVGLLSLNDYSNAGLNDSYLNNNTYFYSSNVTSSNDIWYIHNKGGVNKEANQNNYGIRPVITLRNDVVLTSGDGSIDNPFKIEQPQRMNKITDIKLGEYINYNNYSFRVIDKEENKIKVALDGYIKENDKELVIPFSVGDNEYNFKDEDNLAYYLNNTFYNSLENKDYLVEGDFYTGAIDIYDKANYQKIYDNKVNSYIGLYQIGELFINDYTDTFIMTTLSSSDDTIYSINEEHLLFEINVTETKKVRPVLYFDSDLIINNGEGTKSNPYTLSR